MSSHERLPLLALIIGIIIVNGLPVPTNGALLPVKLASSTGESLYTGTDRLPGGFIPSHYDIEIAPDFYRDPVDNRFNFTGQVTIFVRCTVASNTITLQSKDLTITDLTVKLDPSSPETATQPSYTDYTLSPDVEFLTLNFADTLSVDALYVINVTYEGTLGGPSNPVGIYYDSYVDDIGVTKYMVATQLESNFARRMFPSFDEPEFKATFNITVLRKKPMMSLSNMDLLRSEDKEDGWIADYFAESPIMSTYLVCVCIGNFVYVEAEWQQYTNHRIRLYARPEMKENLRYAAKLAPVFHAWLENETGIAYTLPKMDHIALPTKGGSAMENWGLITYDESVLCVNNETSAVTGKMNSVKIINHELAHQWYGNIVTTKWWNEIWLNEGFANHYNYYPPYAIGWEGSENQQSDSRGTQSFLENDQRNNSDPIIKNIVNNSQSMDSFSGSTYPKGAAIIRMLKGMLTRRSMNAAFTEYLKKYDLKPVTSDNLWEELTKQAAIDRIQDQNGDNLDFKTIMDPWVKQMGYPLVTVTNAGDGTATVTASRYFNPKGQSADLYSEYQYQWTIPVSIATEGTQDWENLRPTFYVDSKNESSTITGLPVGLDKWFVINANQMFFYRVHYDSNTRAALVNQLLTDHTKISSESRGQLVDDSFSLSRSLVIDETEALELTRYLGSEQQFSAWNAALKHLLYADKIFQTFSWYSLYKSYVTSLLVPVYDVTGWEYNDDEPAINQLLRKDISTTTCYYGHADCRSKAQKLYNIKMQNPQRDSNVDANNLPNALCVGLGDDTDSETNWDTAFSEYKRRQRTPITDEREAYLYGLSCTQQLPLLHRYLDRIVGGEIDSRDQITALLYIVRSSNDGRNIVWTYFRNNWASAPSGIRSFGVLRAIAQTWFRDSDLYDFNEFVARNQLGNVNSIVQIQLLIEQNIEWINVNAGPVEKWLRNDTSTPEQSTAVPTASNPTPPPSSASKRQVQVLAVPLSVIAFIVAYMSLNCS